IKDASHNLIKKFNIKIEYLECRNLINLSKKIKKHNFKLFVAYYLSGIRLIDNF
ncbi:pantoate--beta-alanine ligase, partial [Candidatus Pelagibacter sp.]|nr:pantoate--beta-alanine ligase [Candidatus Pelagibacter sp.]